MNIAVIPQRGEHWRWRHDMRTKLIFTGTKVYNNDARTWYQFALIDKPNERWCEVLDTDLRLMEKIP